MKTFLSIVLVALAYLPVAGQDCENGVCPTPTIVYSGPINQEFAEIENQLNRVLQSAPASGPSEKAAARILAGNGCGSGSVCGYYREGSVILTNAHVAGTRVGREVVVRAAVNGRDVDMDGRVIMAAYSDRTLTDWAVVYVEGLKDIIPVKLSKETPSGTHYTRGSPRCVWPQQSTQVVTADIADNSPLWRWRPNSIGGQSGSGVWSATNNLQYGLLTWTWGGLGAGQQTSQIYKQAKERSTNGPVRPAGLLVPTSAPTDIICENGFFAEVGITDLPIWADGSTDPDCPEDPDPVPDCEFTESELASLVKLRDRAKADGVELDHLVTLVIAILDVIGK